VSASCIFEFKKKSVLKLLAHTVYRHFQGTMVHGDIRNHLPNNVESHSTSLSSCSRKSITGPCPEVYEARPHFLTLFH
jgi:hypothetical protein